MRPLSVSAIEAFWRCPQLYHLRYVKGIGRPGYASALAVGKAMHAAGECLRAGADIEAVVGAASQAIDEACDHNQFDVYAAADKVKVCAMLKAYQLRWYGAQPGPFTHDNEVAMRAPLVMPRTGRRSRTFYVRGIADAILPGGLLYEMKTTSDTVAECKAWLEQSIQIPLYQALAVAEGRQVSGTLVDIVKKPVIRRRTSGKNAETQAQYAVRCLQAYADEPERFFLRAELEYSESRCAEAMSIAWETAERIRACDSGGYTALRGPSCKGPYGWCDMRDLCWHGKADGYEVIEDRRYDGATK